MRTASADELRDWMRRFTPRLLAVASALARGPDEAEDILQEVWWKAYRKAHARPAGTPLSVWLHTVTLNEGRSRLRRFRRRLRLRELYGPGGDPHTGPVAAAPPTPTPVHDQINASLRNAELWRAIAALPPLQREVLLLRLVEDMSTAEAAAAIGRAEGTVKASLHRALARLRETLASGESTAAITCTAEEP
jgi:RNA polymerase sigma-70 factor, ECF subfamily